MISWLLIVVYEDDVHAVEEIKRILSVSCLIQSVWTLWCWST